MAEPLIPGGYILLSRKLIDSEIFKKPPLYIKVWIYLLSRAQHSDYKGLKQGELRTSIPEIQDACGWYVGYRKHKPTKDQIFQILEWLRRPHEGVREADARATMIATTKATQGMFIFIENFNFYQTSKNYESNDESNDEKVTRATREQRQPDNINKNVKNVKNDKNINNTSSLQKTESETQLVIEDVPPAKPKVKKSEIKSVFSTEDKEYKLACYLSKQIAKRLDKPLQEEKTLQKWSIEFERMVRRDGYDINEIKDVLVFSQKDPFWQDNIMSASKFRKQYLTLLGKMKKEDD